MKKITSIVLLLSVNLLFSQVAVKDIADVALQSGASLVFDFNDDGTPEFTFQNTFAVGSMFDAQNVNFITFGTLQTGGWDVIKPLVLGTAINAQGNFGAGGDAYINPSWATAGQTFPQGDSYFATKIKLGANQHYGWILVNVNASGLVTVKSYAYEQTPGAGIDAGETATMSASEFSLVDVYAYPNPATDFVHVSYDATLETVSAVDISGKVIAIPFEGTTLNVGHLPQGVYVIQASFSDTKSAVFKLVK